MKKIILLFITLFLLVVSSLAAYTKDVNKLGVTSSVFNHKDFIPIKHACDTLGSDISPPLTFNNIPEGTKSLALILDDPDAPGGTFNHWIIFNIPPAGNGLQEGIPHDSELENGIRQGTNGTEQVGYFGPCPPPKETHRYVFKVFALDTVLELEAGVNKKQLLTAMKRHILGRGKLVGLFKNNTSL